MLSGICHEPSTVALRGVLGHNAAKSCSSDEHCSVATTLAMKKKNQWNQYHPWLQQKEEKTNSGSCGKSWWTQCSNGLTLRPHPLPRLILLLLLNMWECPLQLLLLLHKWFDPPQLLLFNMWTSLLWCFFFLHCNPSPPAHGNISTAAATQRLTPESALGLNELEMIYSVINVSDGFIEWFWFKWIMLVNKALMMTIVINPNFVFSL